MTEETKQNVDKSYTHPETGKFVKGNPGGGRPKGSKSFTTLVKEALKNVADEKGTTLERKLVQTILNKAIEEGDNKMIELIWNYLDGKPTQKIEDNRFSFKDDIEQIRRKIVEERANSEVPKDNKQGSEDSTAKPE